MKVDRPSIRVREGNRHTGIIERYLARDILTVLGAKRDYLRRDKSLVPHVIKSFSQSHGTRMKEKKKGGGREEDAGLGSTREALCRFCETKARGMVRAGMVRWLLGPVSRGQKGRMGIHRKAARSRADKGNDTVDKVVANSSPKPGPEGPFSTGDVEKFISGLQIHCTVEVLEENGEYDRLVGRVALNGARPVAPSTVNKSGSCKPRG
ncbi:hypothetical protein WN48_01918 [Eufriesea mexicana]|uniref:Uncharacterized protein n=1 Tax=Eufriesea mexicana TaxID=516756 RepID=A0A310SGS3_9HYME|nr:hypothetical protein WN48_01918 [Eufriesea mexicana]